MSTLRSNEEWFALIQECRSSGLSDKEWCQMHGISNSAFYYNIRKLRRLACAIPDRIDAPSIGTRQEVVPLVIAEEPASDIMPASQYSEPEMYQPLSVRIECGNISVICPDGVSSSMLCSVIQALRVEC